MKRLLMSYDEKEVTSADLTISCIHCDPWNDYGHDHPCTVGFLNCPFGFVKGGENCESVTREMWDRILLDFRVRIC